MKAMILAAGLGQRMRPLSHLRAKPVLPVLNRPLLHWTLARLARDGFRDVLINLHHLPATVRGAVGDGGDFGVRVRYVHERQILGTGGGPRNVRHWFGGEPVLIVNGDMYFDFDLRALARRHARSGALATLALKPNPDPKRYGPVVTDRAGRVLSILGQPRRARGVLSLFTGVHMLDPACLERLPAGFSDVVRQLYVPLISAGERIDGVRVTGPWFDVGSPASYLESHSALLARGVAGVRRRRLVHRAASVDPCARVVRSVVADGTAIGPGARVVDSVVWEDVVIGPQARVVGCVVASGVKIKERERATNSVVWKKSGRRRRERIY